uniref:Reverse transcriptase Ty1/copia-type domain-containing protein n=1 Tax=Solanum lycopersicum TaxID=4081 RepID=A0A3Q7J6L2_SOLLC
MREINNLKTRFSAAFEMKDLGPAKQILGLKISRDRSVGTLNLSQEFYIEKVLSRFRVNDAKPRTTPLANHFILSKEQSPKTAEERDHMALVPYALVVGSLMYAMVCTRPDIAHAVGVVRSTSLCFGKGKVTLQGFVDADPCGDVESSKRTSGYIYTIGGTEVSWMSRLQKCVSLSSTEAEYAEIAEAGKEMIWLADYARLSQNTFPQKVIDIYSRVFGFMMCWSFDLQVVANDLVIALLPLFSKERVWSVSYA